MLTCTSNVEASRSIVYGGAAMLHESADIAQAGRIAAIAKAWCADAAVRVVEGAIQVHGGHRLHMGYPTPPLPPCSSRCQGLIHAGGRGART